MAIFDHGQFTLVRAQGVVLKKIQTKRKIGSIFKRTVTRIEEIREDFDISDPTDMSALPAKDDCCKYQWDYEGTFELVKLYLFTSDNYYHGTFAVGLITAVDLTSFEIEASIFTIKINPALDAPQVHISYSVVNSNYHEEIRKLKITLIFPSKAAVTEYITSLEPGDEVIIAKLAQQPAPATLQ